MKRLPDILTREEYGIIAAALDDPERVIRNITPSRAVALTVRGWLDLDAQGRPTLTLAGMESATFFADDEAEMAPERIADAVKRLTEFLRQAAALNDRDDTLTGLCTDPKAGRVELRFSDLKAALWAAGQRNLPGETNLKKPTDRRTRRVRTKDGYESVQFLPKGDEGDLELHVDDTVWFARARRANELVAVPTYKLYALRKAGEVPAPDAEPVAAAPDRRELFDVAVEWAAFRKLREQQQLDDPLGSFDATARPEGEREVRLTEINPQADLEVGCGPYIWFARRRRAQGGGSLYKLYLLRADLNKGSANEVGNAGDRSGIKAVVRELAERADAVEFEVAPRGEDGDLSFRCGEENWFAEHRQRQGTYRVFRSEADAGKYAPLFTAGDREELENFMRQAVSAVIKP